jgi:Fe-S-cluster containining protein
VKLTVLPNERFSCNGCTNCCRYWWHIECLPGERERIERQKWTDALRPPGDWFTVRGGRTYLAHGSDGACVFLNQQTGRCTIHETFGGTVKPLGCQLYPFQISPTFPGEATVTTRHDCPTVRRNQGAPHADELPTLRKFATELHLGAGFTDLTCCHLTREQITAVVEFLSALMNGFDTDEQRAVFIAWTADWISTLNADQLDRAALAQTFGPLKQLVEASTRGPTRRPGLIARFAFRTLLALHLRRDEDVLDGRASRLGRMIAMLKVVLGFGGFRQLGVQHPAGSLRKAALFRQADRPHVRFELLWRVVRTKLESFQFMGQGNGGKDFLEGLRSLAMLQPLVLATARYAAANRGSAGIEEQDIDYAIAAIEHSFGRQAVLKQGFVRSIEKLLMDHDLFVRLLRTV